MLDSSHALAGGSEGLLYRGVLTDGIWQWTPVADSAKQFVCHSISDICVLDSQTAFVSSASMFGSIIKTTDGGVTWSASYTGNGYDTTDGISFYSGSGGWRVGS